MNRHSGKRSASRIDSGQARMTSSNTFARIYNVVSQIPKGNVLTYQDVAKQANINNPRIVGFALHRNKDPKNIPCHRVVSSKGFLARGYAFGGVKKQQEKLKREGVLFMGKGLVDLDACLMRSLS